MKFMFQTDIRHVLLEEGVKTSYTIQDWIQRNIIGQGRQILSITPLKYEEISNGSNHGHGYRIEAKFVVVHFKPEYRDCNQEGEKSLTRNQPPARIFRGEPTYATRIYQLLLEERKSLWIEEIADRLGVSLAKMESLREPLQQLVEQGFITRRGAVPNRIYYEIAS